MSKQIHFLGWDKPVTESAAKHILNKINSTLVRMDGTLIVVPTKEAGRRLREKMMILCHERQAALLDLRIVTPMFFLQSRESAAAGETILRSVWIRTLLSVRKDDCPALFPRDIPENNHQWAFAMSKIIQQLREELSDACLSIHDVLEKHGAELPELQRWRDLGKIEALYLDNLKKTGLADPCALKLANAKSPEIPDGINKIILASVPDPSLLALATLSKLSGKVDVEVLVMAPEKLRDHFDDWGRPLPDKWLNRPIDIPEAEQNILVAADPAGQAQFVADLISGHEYHFNDICIGVPDRTVIPFLQNKLESAGLIAFDPADCPVKDHHLYHLIKAWCLLAENASYKNFSEFLRQADVLKYLQATRDVNTSELLCELDQFQNKVLPQTIPDVESALKKTREGEFHNLKIAFKFTGEILPDGNGDYPPAVLRGLLERVFSIRTITGGSDDDEDFKAAASGISGILNDMTYADSFIKNFPARLVNRLVLGQLDEIAIPRHREGALVDLNGWLELSWNDAPLMIITGFNEGQVPDSQKSDIFLPDSLKKTLGLRNNDSRFARDAYLLSLIIAMRAAPPGVSPSTQSAKKGRVVLITGKTSPEGDPLKPSRLLFRCPDEELAKRAEHIFREIEDRTQRPPFTVTFKLDPTAPLSVGPKILPFFLPMEIHATQFRDYLACPFRFFLRHILKMERVEEKTELDALDFGTAIHAILEKFSANPRINNSTDSLLIQKHLDGLLDDYFNIKYGNNDSFPILYARATARQRLKAFAEHQAHSASDGWEIVEREFSCEMTINGMKVIGKIDRIDRKKGANKMRILDYKTSDSSENPAGHHIRKSRKDIPDYARVHTSGNERWNDLQLPLYRQMFLDAPFGKECQDVELCYFNLPKAVSNSGIFAWEKFDADIADSAAKSAERIIERIKQCVFWPPSETLQYDDFESLFEEDMRDYFDGEKIKEFIATKMHK